MSPAMNHIDRLRQRYHEARRAAEQKQAERDALGLVNVPHHDHRHLDHRDEPTRRRWRELDAEMWQLRHHASVAWEAYSAAMQAQQ